MSDIEKTVSFPLDNGFLRRACPYCRRDFKILLRDDELIGANKRADDATTSESDKQNDSLNYSIVEKEGTCPYCGQQASADSWWTQEQRECLEVITHNIASEILNEQFIRPLERNFRSSGFMQLNVKEIKQQTPSIPVDSDDMKVFDLPCCQRKIKVLNFWDEMIYCFFCGYPYSQTFMKSSNGNR
jgi:hypothetical protein